MVYIAEAHADDVWPLGYGISQSKNLEEKENNCDRFLDQFPDLVELIDATLLDNMSNDFIMKTGAWPEGYFITDPQGYIDWKRTITRTNTCQYFAEDAKRYLSSLEL